MADTRVDALRRALALNRMMRDEAQAALRQIDEALKAVNRRAKETRLELRRARVEADDASLRASRARRRQRSAGESFFALAGDDVGPPEPNVDTLRVRRLLRGIPLGGASDRSSVWPRQWLDELGETVAELLRGALLERSRRQGYASVVITSPEPQAVATAPVEPHGDRLTPFAPFALPQPAREGQPVQAMVPWAGAQPHRAATSSTWLEVTDDASPSDCAALLDRLVACSAQINALPMDQLVAASPGLDSSFWAEAARTLAAKLGGEKAAHPSADDCARHWALHPLNPTVETAAAWSAQEDALLVQLARAGTHSWEAIAALHAEGRPRKRPLIDLVKRYQQMLNPRMTRHAWSAQEDALLSASVARHGRGNWMAVSADLPLRTNSQCMLRYQKTIDPRINRGKWEPHEDVLLQASVAVHSSSAVRARTAPLSTARDCKVAWVKVKLTVPRRTDAQCRERFVNVADPLIQRSAGASVEWAGADDARLSALVYAHWRPGSGCGSWRLVPWSRVAQQMAPLRVSDAECRRRFFAHLATDEQKAEYRELTQLKRAVLPSNYGGRRAERPSVLASSLFRLRLPPPADDEAEGGDEGAAGAADRGQLVLGAGAPAGADHGPSAALLLQMAGTSARAAPETQLADSLAARRTKRAKVEPAWRMDFG